jgi:redox-sensitive bicupin YhaK (pirin superfamily)
MLTLRRAEDRGHADHGWLRSFHSFSFAAYHDPRHMGVGNLRVLNDDRIAPGSGFGTHGHRDMEIISVVLEGELAHRDSLGNGAPDRPGAAADGVIRPGDVQRMSAGTGVLHSEFNHAADRVTHFLQIWILPDRPGGAPGYEQRHFPPAQRRGRLALLVSPTGEAGSLSMGADARLHGGLFDAGESAELPLAAGRLGYVHVARGRVRVNGELLAAGDALTLEHEPAVRIDEGEGAEVLVFDLRPR